jgi:hypothetical protein
LSLTIKNIEIDYRTGDSIKNDLIKLFEKYWFKDSLKFPYLCKNIKSRNYGLISESECGCVHGRQRNKDLRW